MVKKIFFGAYRAMSCLPSILFVALVIFTIRASIHLGFVPTYDNPDPQKLQFNVHHSITMFLVKITFLSIMIWVIITLGILIIKLLNKKVKIDTKSIGVFLIGLSLLIFLRVLGIMEWFMD